MCNDCFESFPEDDMMFCHRCDDAYCMACGSECLLNYCHCCGIQLCEDCYATCKFDEVICKNCLDENDVCVKFLIGECEKIEEFDE